MQDVARLFDNLNVRRNFSGARDILGYAAISGGYEKETISYGIFYSEIGFSLDMTQLPVQRDLLVGFLDAGSEQSGFESMTLQHFCRADACVERGVRRACRCAHVLR